MLGCVSDLELSDQIRCLSNDNQCKTCMGSRNCNSKSSFAKCIQCDTKSDTNCAKNPGHSNSQVCKYYNDMCYSLIDIYDVSRGCLNDHRGIALYNAPEKYEVCSTKTGNGCNDKPIIMETCVHCNSEIDGKCRDEPIMYKGKICSTMESTKREGCYLFLVRIKLNLPPLNIVQ